MSEVVELQESIDSEQAYQAALHTLNEQRGDSSMLHRMMNTLESYRQKRKMGWSRPWNKYGVTTFQSFQLRQGDEAWLQQAAAVLRELELTALAREFCEQLLADPAWMGFLFFSELREQGVLYETATLSLGRRALGNPRQRDRLDIVFDVPLDPSLEAKEVRLRVFVDPLRADDMAPLAQFRGVCESVPAQHLLQLLSDASWQWQHDAARHWTHWTSRYIDYFGARQYQPNRAMFYLEGGSRQEAA